MSGLEWVEELKVVDLRKRLKEKGANTSGKKAILVERLKTALAQEEKEEEAEQAEADEMDVDGKGEVGQEEEGGKEEETEKKTTKGGLNELLGDGKDDLEFDFETDKPNRKKQKVQDASEKTQKQETTQKEPDTSGQAVKVPEMKTTEEEVVDFETQHGEKKEADVAVQTTEVQRTTSGVEAMDLEAPEVAEADRTCALRIQNFVRPFTEKAAKEMLSTYGTVVDMWMPPIKTHCYVLFEKAAEAHDAYLGTYNVVWPRGGKHLRSQFVTEEDAKKAIEDGRSRDVYARPSGSASYQKTRPLPYPPNSRAATVNAPAHGPTVRPTTKPALSLEDLFCKTRSKPPIYYLPLTDEQVAERKRLAEEKEKPSTKPSEEGVKDG